MRFRISKVVRYMRIYGIARTIIKAAGRVRIKFPFWLFLLLLNPSRNGRKVGIIGCGQFSYSVIAYYLTTCSNSKLEWCFDINRSASKSLASAYGIDTCFAEENHLNNSMVDIVYIASNHSSHTPYAIKYLRSGCDVYVEKPLSTTSDQLAELKQVVNESGKKLYIGYNRPFSPSIKLIRENLSDEAMPFTLSCFVTGHYISEDHWYRDPNEGTRVCGNLGHWLDLAIHMLYWSSDRVPFVDIDISYSNKDTPSDNFCTNLTTPRGDLISLTFSSRSEPFEGVNETINFQQGSMIAKINDHRHIQIWDDEKYISKKFWQKNVGHKDAILQPFDKENTRDWIEILDSTKIMLLVSEMVKNLETSKRYYLEKNYS